MIRLYWRSVSNNGKDEFCFHCIKVTGAYRVSMEGKQKKENVENSLQGLIQLYEFWFLFWELHILKKYNYLGGKKLFRRQFL